MPIEIERINDDKCELGEGPFWDEESQSLYYVDIPAKTVNRYTPSTKVHVKALVGLTVSFIIPVEGQENTFLVGYGNEIAKLTWDGVSDKIDDLETVVELKNTEEKVHRWNDGKADPSGRLWAGTLTGRSGRAALYALKSDNTLVKLISGVTISNGLAWNEKIHKFYYIDTGAGEVYQFDYNDLEISNREVIFKLSGGSEGGPDGMTIDSDGNLWIANFGGGRVLKIDPRKPNTLLQSIDMPVDQVTSVEFGGPNYEDLYVTTARLPLDQRALGGGWTYKITGLGVRGLPVRKVKL